MGNVQFELMDRAAAVESIRKLNEDDLRFLNHVIVDRLKLIHQARSTVMLAQFSVGDRVKFPANDGSYKSGMIFRLNKKTASITTDDGQRWNVHPSYLMADSATNDAERQAAWTQNIQKPFGFIE